MRLFVALDVPDRVREALAELSARLKKTCLSARWVRLESVHITLKFIGEVSLETVEKIREALDRLIHGRTAVVIAVLGRETPGLSAVIAESFHLVILPSKMSAMTGAVSLRLLTPDRLYASVIGPITTGK